MDYVTACLAQPCVQSCGVTVGGMRQSRQGGVPARNLKRPGHLFAKRKYLTSFGKHYCHPSTFSDSAIIETQNRKMRCKRK
jgi:hypothetical protein